MEGLGMNQQESIRAAFFDLDRTLIPGSSLFLLARGLYDRDMFRVRDLVRFGWGQAMFKLRGERQRNMEKSRTSTLEFVTGRSQQELMDWGREIAEDSIMPRVYEDIVKVIDGHRERGDKTYLVTAAPIEVAKVIAEALHMDGAIGTVSEVDDAGYYTGRLEGDVLHGPAKAKAVQEKANDENITLEECAAYSDSINDLPLLELVGDPHAVNPERELRLIALRRGWPIHELRTRRKALLVGIPAGIGGASLFGSGIMLGMYLQRRKGRDWREPLNRIRNRLNR
jgi:HAD superfamily hydrolase (TIGR01490 family)